MLYSTLSQFWEFMALALCGAAMAVEYAAFALLRRLMAAGFWLSLACDALMGALWGATACAFLTLAAMGRGRAYHFCAMASGFMLAVAVGKLLLGVGARIKRRAGNVGKVRMAGVLKRVFR